MGYGLGSQDVVWERLMEEGRENVKGGAGFYGALVPIHMGAVFC